MELPRRALLDTTVLANGHANFSLHAAVIADHARIVRSFGNNTSVMVLPCMPSSLANGRYDIFTLNGKFICRVDFGSPGSSNMPTLPALQSPIVIVPLREVQVAK